eukprot:CAMPEP_0198352726 /NCGR_PEP_ID=MMETSP1450-20131203/108449_1 /TAXON_ID=753684 ORGANISM="Madagascaria erythrocladiodes, Strain CCMP3234" /NCGR_SAMPLE_ID=MMETSP1450 /ASSEMBLY_ACC=CAM_ASM_001115 /LENGTH=39 /DNA_ID= /DNA_START= /DNA_END= /DNA_ORIENTATION=
MPPPPAPSAAATAASYALVSAALAFMVPLRMATSALSTP